MARSRETIGSFAADLVTALGGKPTKQAQSLFNAWQRWEGGWTNNRATYNPLNLTAPGSGLPTINSVGVVALPSYQAGIQRTADLIRSGYPTIAKALQTGQYDFSNPALQADFNRWLTGNRTPGMSKYVSKIAGSLGVPVSQVQTLPGGPAAAPAAVPGVPQMPTFNEGRMGQSISELFLQGGGRVDFSKLPGAVESSWDQPQAPEVLPQATGKLSPQQTTTPQITGKGINLPASFKSTHNTSNLGWPAIDIMGHPGTPVRTPVAGTIIRHGSAQGGQALYLDTNGDGEGDYWLGHVENMLPVGTQVKAGQAIATISPDHRAPHAHWAKR